MAKLIVSNLVSLDGFCAGHGGDLSGLPMGPAFDDYNVALLRTAGTLVFGRTTFSMFSAFWPQVERDATAGPVLREIATLTGAMGKLVVSDTLELDSSKPWGDAQVVRRAESRARIAQLKAGTGPDLLMFGGRMVANDLLAHGLVDELHLLVHPIVVGHGTKLFEDGATVPLQLVSSQTFSTGVVYLVYGPAVADAS
jgi:dihydrofolate reductase